ncbi:MAG: hypothetical protein ACJAYK_002951, partial [Crocinitomicaceae bacterium]
MFNKKKLVPMLILVTGVAVSAQAEEIRIAIGHQSM